MFLLVPAFLLDYTTKTATKLIKSNTGVILRPPLNKYL